MTTYFKAKLDIDSQDFVESLKESPQHFLVFLTEMFKQASDDEIREAAEKSKGRQEILQRFIENPQEAAELLFQTCEDWLPYNTEEHESPDLATKYAIELIERVRDKSKKTEEN